MLTSSPGNQGKKPAVRRAKRMPRLDTIKMVEDALKSDITFATKKPAVAQPAKAGPVSDVYDYSGLSGG